MCSQLRRLHKGTRGHVSPLLKMAGHGGTVGTRTANKKLTKRVLTVMKTINKTTNCTCRAKKVEEHDPKKILVMVQFRCATSDLMLIQQNKFYCISDRSEVAHLTWTVTEIQSTHHTVNSSLANFGRVTVTTYVMSC